MYIAFTEEQAQEIRSHGISVIRFKWMIKNSISIIQWYGMQLGKAIQQFADVLSDAFNEMQSVLEKTADITRCKNKYKFVKHLSKCGCCNCQIRTETRHTWLARSNI